MKPDSIPNLRGKKKKVGFCIEIGVTEKPERVHSLTQLNAAFLKSLSVPGVLHCSVPVPAAGWGAHTGIHHRAGDRCLIPNSRLEKSPAMATASCVSFGSNLKLHCPPQNNPNVQNQYWYFLVSPVTGGQYLLPTATVPQPLGSPERSFRVRPAPSSEEALVPGFSGPAVCGSALNPAGHHGLSL